jgi:hypothetical protein
MIAAAIAAITPIRNQTEIAAAVEARLAAKAIGPPTVSRELRQQRHGNHGSRI